MNNVILPSSTGRGSRANAIVTMKTNHIASGNMAVRVAMGTKSAILFRGCTNARIGCTNARCLIVGRDSVMTVLSWGWGS